MYTRHLDRERDEQTTRIHGGNEMNGIICLSLLVDTAVDRIDGKKNIKQSYFYTSQRFIANQVNATKSMTLRTLHPKACTPELRIFMTRRKEPMR